MLGFFIFAPSKDGLLCVCVYLINGIFAVEKSGAL